MACPYSNCLSEDTRVAERGGIEDTYFCHSCHRSYKKVSMLAKTVIATTIGGVFLGPLGAAIAGSIVGGVDDVG